MIKDVVIPGIVIFIFICFVTSIYYQIKFRYEEKKLMRKCRKEEDNK